MPQPTLYPIKPIGQGFLAITAKPSGEWLDDDISVLRQQDIALVVSLLTAAEARELGLAEQEAVCQKHGLEFMSFPIVDRGVPDSVTLAAELIYYIHQAVSGGKNTVIHCRAGIGRSSLIAAGVLLRENFSPFQAFTLITQKRRVLVPDTREQKQWLEQHAAALAQLGGQGTAH